MADAAGNVLRSLRRAVRVLGCGVLCLAAVSAPSAEPTPFDRATRAALVAQSMPELSAALAALEGLNGLEAKDAATARKLIANLRLERGMQLYDALVRLATENPGQHQPQISALARQATADFEAASQSDPKLAAAWLGFARIQALPGGDRPRALAALDEAIKLGPNADALRLRGSVRTQNGQFAEALADLEESRKLDPKHPQTHEARAVVLAAQGKLDEAEKALDQAIEFAPKMASPRLARARLNVARKNRDKAIADLTGLLSVDPANLHALLMRAGLWEQAGLADPQRADYETILKLQPQAMDVQRLRAGLLKRTGKLDASIAEEEQRVAAGSGLAPRLSLGTLYLSKQEYAKAAEQFTAALAVDANSIAAYIGRGEALVGEKKYEQAAVDYGRAIERNPRDPHVLNNLAWLLATSPGEKVRDGRRAVELATEACRLTDHKQPTFLSTLAAAQAERGDFDKAVETAAKGIALATGEVKSGLEKELAAYKAGKPWRVE